MKGKLKILTLLLMTLLLSLSLLAGCGGATEAEDQPSEPAAETEQAYDDAAQEDHNEKDDQRQEEVYGAPPCNSKQSEQPAVHGRNSLAAPESGIDRKTVTDSGCKSAESHCSVVSPEKLRDQ